RANHRAFLRRRSSPPAVQGRSHPRARAIQADESGDGSTPPGFARKIDRGLEVGEEGIVIMPADRCGKANPRFSLSVALRSMLASKLWLAASTCESSSNAPRWPKAPGAMPRAPLRCERRLEP